MDGLHGFSLQGESVLDQSGGCSNAGDINNDGITDFVIGAVGSSSYSGRSYVIFGSLNASYLGEWCLKSPSMDRRSTRLCNARWI